MFHLFFSLGGWIAAGMGAMALIFVFEVVLSFAEGLFAEVDGVLRAVVVAGHAADALVLPLGSAVDDLDVENGTGVLAYATAHAAVEHSERTVGDKEALEQGSHWVRLEPGHGAFGESLLGGTTADGVGYLGQQLAGGVYLASFAFGGVELEAGQVDIGLGHDDAVCRRECEASAGQYLGHDVGCASHIVAGSTYHIYIARTVLHHEVLHELPHYGRWCPRIDGKDQAHGFVGGKLIALCLTVAHHVGDETCVFA